MSHPARTVTPRSAPGRAAPGGLLLRVCLAQRAQLLAQCDAAAAARWTERATAPPARPWLLVNPRSSDGTAGRVGLVDGARARGVSVHELAPGDDPARLE
jgi:hypothetical protein